MAVLRKTKWINFATRRYLNFLKLPIDVVNKIFNSSYLPILLYGSEVWSIYDKDDTNPWEKDIIEKTHIYFCKQVLGVNKQCPNVACRNELGRLPLKELTDLNVIKFWKHLENQPENSIAKQCLHISAQMADKNQMSLMQKVNDLCKKANLNPLNLDENNTFISQVRLTLNKELT